MTKAKIAHKASQYSTSQRASHKETAAAVHLFDNALRNDNEFEEAMDLPSCEGGG